jgi:hypothetical protein
MGKRLFYPGKRNMEINKTTGLSNGIKKERRDVAISPFLN